MINLGSHGGEEDVEECHAEEGHAEEALTSTSILLYDHQGTLANNRLTLLPANSRDLSVAHNELSSHNCRATLTTSRLQLCQPVVSISDFSYQVESVPGRSLGFTDCEDGTSLE